MTEIIEHFISKTGVCSGTKLVTPDITDLFETDRVFQFDISEKRTCHIPILAKSYKDAAEKFKDWYENHIDGVEDLLENGTSGRKVYLLPNTFSVEEYPADDLIFIREMEEDHVFE